jgi:hypothetical protein
VRELTEELRLTTTELTAVDREATLEFVLPRPVLRVLRSSGSTALLK